MPLSNDYSDGPGGKKLPAVEYNVHANLTNTHTTQIAANTAAIVDLGGTPVPSPVPNLSRVVDFGYCQSEIGHEEWYTTEEIETILAGIKASGATRVRFAAWWAAFEPTTRGVYDWDGLDRALNLCDQYGLTPLVCIVQPPPAYASPTVADFANACGDLAARYGSGGGTGQVHDYEIWNEPNHTSFYSTFAPSFGGTHYTSLLIAAANAIRSADNEAFIISAGLMSTIDWSTTDILPSTFLQDMYDAGAKDYFDAFGFHWYLNTPDFTDWVEPAVDETFYVDLLACYDIMAAEGDGDKKIWVTEVGLPEPDVDPATRGDWIARQIEMMRALDFVENFWIYNYRCTDDSLTGSAQLGAVTFDFEERQPFYDTIASINSLTKTVPDGSVTAEKMADDAVGVAQLNFTGTPDGTKFPRGDGVWAVPGGGGGGGTPDWDDVTDKPTTFPPTAHTHVVADLTDYVPGGGGGGSLVGYLVAVGAVTGNVPVTITHNLGTRNVNVVVRRTHLVTGGLTDTTPGEQVGVKWSVTSANTITLDPSDSWGANEFFCLVSPMGVTGDVTAPTAPTLSYSTPGSTTVPLTVTGSTGSPVGYNWYRSGVLVDTTSATSTTATGLTSSTAYSFTAKAFDLSGNESGASNTVTPTTAAANAVLDTVGAGVRTTGTLSIAASQVVTAGANKHMIAWVVISQNLWATVLSDFNTLTLTSSLSGSMTKRQSLLFGPSGQEQASIHLFEYDNPLDGTHTLTLTGIPGFIGAPAGVMIFSASYHNVASVANIATYSSSTNVTALNQNVTSATSNLAVCCHSNEFAITGFSKTVRDSDGGSVDGFGDYAVFGEAAGAATVNFATSSTGRHGFIGANLVKA